MPYRVLMHENNHLLRFFYEKYRSWVKTPQTSPLPTHQCHEREFLLKFNYDKYLLVIIERLQLYAYTGA